MRRSLVLLILLVAPGAAWAHWTIASQLIAAEPARAFHLRLHYQILAGQSNPDEALRVCFWIERHRDGRYREVTGRDCRPLTLRANQWLTLPYSTESLPGLDGAPAGRLPPGNYRAVAVIESDVNPIVRFFVGAAQDRKILPFQIE